MDRFLNHKSEIINGPGTYEINNSGFENKTYNKTNEGYIGDKSQRFEDVKIRPNLGPGAYSWVIIKNHFNFSFNLFANRCNLINSNEIKWKII